MQNVGYYDSPFVVPHNQQIVTILQFFHIPHFPVRNQNLNIQENLKLAHS